MDWKRNEEAWLCPKVNAAEVSLAGENSYSSSSTDIGAVLKPNANDMREFICGWGSAVINTSVTYPINKIIFRQVSVSFIKKLNLK